MTAEHTPPARLGTLKPANQPNLNALTSLEHAIISVLHRVLIMMPGFNLLGLIRFECEPPPQNAKVLCVLGVIMFFRKAPPQTVGRRHADPKIKTSPDAAARRV